MAVEALPSHGQGSADDGVIRKGHPQPLRRRCPVGEKILVVLPRTQPMLTVGDLRWRT